MPSEAAARRRRRVAPGDLRTEQQCRPPNPYQWADLWGEKPDDGRERRDQRERRGRQDRPDNSDERRGVDERGDRAETALAVPIGERAEHRTTDRGTDAECGGRDAGLAANEPVAATTSMITPSGAIAAGRRARKERAKNPEPVDGEQGTVRSAG